MSPRAAAAKGDADFDLEIAGQTLVGHVAKTATWEDVQNVKLGRIQLGKAGKYTVKVRPNDAATWKAINLGPVRFNKKG